MQRRPPLSVIGVGGRKTMPHHPDAFRPLVFACAVLAALMLGCTGSENDDGQLETGDREVSANLALGKPVTASSQKGGLEARYANDGSLSTRWGSDYSDPQWI